MKVTTLIISIVFICSSTSEVFGQQLSNSFLENNRKCMDIGGYCQNHWDCCSNSCLSFSYKCVRSYKPRPVGPVSSIPIAGVPQPEGSLTVNRFGESQYPIIYYQQFPIVGNAPEIVNSIDELINRLSLNNPPSSSSSSSSSTNEQNQQNTLNNRFSETDGAETGSNSSPVCLADGLRCDNAPACCSLSCKYNVCQTGYQVVNGPELSNTGRCLKIGAMCSRNSECCTGRCPSFLSKCAT